MIDRDVLVEPLTRGLDWRRGLVEFLPPFLIALLLLPFVMKNGRLWPWEPNTIDLRVYVLAVQDMMHGKSIYDTATPVDDLKFIYPPIAALLFTPLALGPLWFWQLLWTGVGVWAQQSVLRRFRVPRGWLLALLGVVVVLVVEPIRTTLGYGQVNTMLMALVVADLLPLPGERRRIPAGALIGLAAAIKLTPLLFLVFLVLIARKAAALVGAVSFALFTLVGFLVLPAESVRFWRSLGQGDVKTAGPVYVGNQSWSGVTSRFAEQTRPWVVAGLLIGFAVAGLAILVAAWWWRRGEQWFAVALVGMATVLASPLSWTHHHVWVVPLLVATSLSRLVPAWAVWLSRAWAIWISACLILSVMPYGAGIEGKYNLWGQLVGNAGPLLGTALVLGLGVDWVAGGGLRRAESPSHVTAAPVDERQG